MKTVISNRILAIVSGLSLLAALSGCATSFAGTGARLAAPESDTPSTPLDETTQVGSLPAPELKAAPSVAVVHPAIAAAR